MPESNTKSSSDNSKPDFVLKHRIAGAAFLLFFGALFLPWLLGAPDSGLDADANSLTEQPTTISSENVDQALVSALADEQISNQEQVYISKITPLDAERKQVENGGLAVKSAVNRAKTLESLADEDDVDASTGTQAKPSLNEGVTPKAVIKNKELSERKSDPSSNTATKKDAGPDKSPIKIGKPAADIVQQNKQVDDNRIDVGWMVQVGVFTDKRGANRVVEDLRGKGFTPSTSIVDTNRGKNTGTRIWLGPFAQRVDAAKAKNYLTEKTGEAGFIRAYP